MRERNVGLEQMPMRPAVPLGRRSLSDLFGIGAEEEGVEEMLEYLRRR